MANLYYAQPLMEAISRSFQASAAAISLAVAAIQFGFASGLVLLVPLGDVLERRRLVVSMVAASTIGLIGMAMSSSLLVFTLAALLLGLTSVVAQVVVAVAANLASESERGRAVGTVMTGLLIGVLLSRTFAGALAELSGWRTVYWVAAALMLILSAVLWRWLPGHEPTKSIPYPKLLRSVLTIVREEPVLRRRALYGAFQFGAFNALWASLAFLLAGPPYGYGEGTIGLFGLAGIAGALAAGFAGRLADRGWQRFSTGGFLGASLAAFVFMYFGSSLLVSLIIGIVLLDLGVQGSHIINQTQIYRLRPDARSRLTTVYMTSFFIGGASGSTVSAVGFALWGWVGVCAVGWLFTGMAFLFWFSELPAVQKLH